MRLQGVGSQPVPPESVDLMSNFVEELRTRLVQALPACSVSMKSYVAEAGKEVPVEVA